MKIMNRVTLQYLLKNRKRTIVTILGVIISAAMISGVSTMIDSFLNLMQRDSIYTDGNWQIQYNSVLPENTDSILSHPGVAQAGQSRFAGFFQPDTAPAEGPSYLYLEEYDTANFAVRNIHLVSGRLPQAPGEIIIGDKSKWELQPGDTISGNFGQIESHADEVSLLQENIVSQKQDNNVFLPKAPVEYQVVGIFQEFNVFSKRLGANAILLLDTTTATTALPTNVTVCLKKVGMDVFKDPLQLNAYAGDGVDYNNDFLRYSGILQDDQVMATLYTAGGIVSIIILVGSVLLIYNAFAISISERSRQLGMLASVGATKRQKRNSVFFEGALIGIIAIPLGIVFGILGIGITFWFLTPLLMEMMNLHVPFQISVSLPMLLGAVLFSALTIFISVLRPAMRASKITPIDAIRQTKDVMLTGKAVRTSRVIRRIFGFEGELALKNLKRNKKRYRATILSLSVSLLLFLTVSAFTHFLTKSYELTDDDLRFDISLGLYSQERSKIDEITEQVRNLSGITSSTLTPSNYLYGFTEVDTAMVGDDVLRLGSLESSPNKQRFNVQITTMDEIALARYCKEIGISPALLSGEGNPAILLNPIRLKQNGHYQQVTQIKLSKGETLALSCDLVDEAPNPTGIVVPLTIVGQSMEKPIYLPATTKNWEEFQVIVSPETYWKLYDSHHEALYEKTDPEDSYLAEVLYLTSNQPDKLEEELYILLEDTSINYGLFNATFQRIQMSRLTTMLSVFVYGFIALISLITVATIFNTISTSVALRRREFAMLKSVGMTPAGFNRMIRYESLFYGLKALLYGIPLGVFLSYLIYQALGASFAFPFSLPWVSFLVGIVCIFLVVGLTMLYSGSKVKRMGIIDALTDENL